MDVKSLNKGLLLPRTDTTTLNNNGNALATGLLIYQTTDNKFYYYNGAYWVTLKIADYTDAIADTDGDTKIEVEANSDEDTIRFITGGTEYLNLSTGRIQLLNTGSSVLIGKNAGGNDDFTNNRNTIIGTDAGTAITTNGYNVAVGYRSLEYALSSFNTAIGTFSGAEITTGQFNTSLGNSSLQATTIGSSNVAIGLDALRLNVSGEENTVVGRSAGYNLQGTGNVMLGSYAGHNETGSNKLYIDNSNASNPLIWGDFANDQVKKLMVSSP